MYRKRKNPRETERRIEMKRLIYAEDAMHRIKMETRFYSGTYAEIERAIDSAPTIEPKRIKAGWVCVGEDACNTYYECPVCESVFASCNHFKYCPECGTRMVNANE